MTIGATNSSFYTGDLVYTTLAGGGNATGFWALDVSDVTVNGKSLGLSQPGVYIDRSVVGTLRHRHGCNKLTMPFSDLQRNELAHVPNADRQ